ncbi:MAG: site-specific integrase [Flavipsychrobacter sp.]|nr:site-specific integrase [Flavipsychrobacter sp.]
MSLQHKFLIDTRRVKANGTFPVKLRVYSPAGNKEVALGIAVRKEDWDEINQIVLPSDPNFKVNSLKLHAAKAKVERKILLAEQTDERLIPEDIVSYVAKKIDPKSKVTIRSFSDDLIDGMKKAGRAGHAMAYRGAVNSIINYTGNEQLRFEDITYKLLDKYNVDMLSGCRKKGTKKLKINAVAAYLRSLRAIYNKAIKAEVVDAKHYPFSKFTIETEETISRALTLEEIRAILTCDLEHETPVWHNRNYFILSFCLIGINFADLFTLTPEAVKEERVVYRRSKTGRIYNIGIHPIVKGLFEYYAQQPSKSGTRYLMPTLPLADNPLATHNNIKQITKVCNEYLKRIAMECGISKNVSTYWGRYTWANLAKKELKLSNDLIADALGHQYGNKVTGIYLDSYSNEAIDDANYRVINLVFGTDQTSFPDPKTAAL